jgi:2,3-bisphosphoglycerate-independent phosphoglycerate mutase
MEKKPVVLVVMDGVGYTDKDNGNAVMHAYKPNLDNLYNNYPHTTIKASGLSVGLPSEGDMGNSEVGHNALGCGQIYSQGAKLVNESIDSRAIFETETWKKLVNNASGHTMHFIGLLSDGNIHSHIKHLVAMIKQAKAEGLTEVRVHALLDGRDVPATSGLTYIGMIEDVMTELNDDTFNACIASGGGRMTTTMDRYDADWSMVESGWKAHVLGEAKMFASATEAYTSLLEETEETDQNLPAFVIAKDGKPIGAIEDHDSVVLFNFRGDRAIEISKAFDDKEITQFDRIRVPNVIYAGMLEYDGDLHIPNNYLVNPPKIEHTMSEYFVAKGIKSYAISETQKFGHMTYFWNGNNSSKFSEELETWVEVPSDVIPFDQRPWMKAAEVTDKLVEAILSKEYDFLRVNYPNGDMVGHTGNFQAAIIGVEAVDLCLARLMKACDKAGYSLMIMADHGNADEMYEKKKKPTDATVAKTSHTLAKVPFIVYNAECEVKEGDFGLSNVAASVAELLGLEVPTEWNESIIK